MRLSSISYLTRQGWKNMVNNRLMTVASVGILTACLFITGAAVLLGLNVNNFATYLAGQNEIIVYLKDGIEQPADGTAADSTAADSTAADSTAVDSTAADSAAADGTAADSAAADGTAADTQLVPVDIDAAVAVIEGIDNVESYTYVSKDEALKEAIDWMGNYASLLEGYQEDNPMPASFRITVKNLEELDDTVAQLETIQGVEYVKSPSDMAQILVTLKKAVNWVALGLVTVLGLVCVVVIANTIRLTVFARRKEINIMKYVGATNAFIRWPFFVEGMTSGLVAGLLAFGLISLGYTELVKYMTTRTDTFTWLNNVFYTILPYSALRSRMLLAFVGVGVVLGGIGTAGSVRKYLKV